MKRIKPVVLKDATKLTNSEMKSIRGGYEPERSSTCSMLCPVEYGGSSITLECPPSEYCDFMTNAWGLACYTQSGEHYHNGKEELCEKPVEG